MLLFLDVLTKDCNENVTGSVCSTCGFQAERPRNRWTSGTNGSVNCVCI